MRQRTNATLFHMKTFRKHQLLLVCTILLLVLAAGLAFYLRSRNASPGLSHEEPALTVTNLNVGKADCAVIRSGDTIGIIDTGTEESYRILDAWLKERRIKDIDYLILTHYDRDHIGGAIQLLKDRTVETVYLADYESEKALYPALMDALSGKPQATFVKTATELAFDDLSVQILPAEDPAPLLADPNTRDNNMSLVCMLTYGENRLLFAGDIEKDRIRQMLDTGEDLDADWIKWPHHGKYQKIDSEFLDQVTPEYVVISTSEEKAPSEKLDELLSSEQIERFCTIDGNMETVSDGHMLHVQKEAAK